MACSVLVIGVGHIAVCPLAVTLIDRAKYIGGSNIPLVDEEIQSLYIVIVCLVVIATGIVVHHHRYLAICTNLLYQFEHIVAPLTEDSVGIAGTMNTFIAKRKAKDNITAEVADEIVVTIKEIDCCVATDRYVACVERRAALALFMTGDELLTIEITIAFIVCCTLSVCHRRAEDRDAILVDGCRDVVNHLLHVDCNGVCSSVLIDVFCALALFCFAKSISCGCALQAFDGIGIVVVECEIHRLVHPLLRRCLLQCYFSFEDAIALIGNCRTACAHIATDVHGDGENGYCIVCGADGDAGHTVFAYRERCVAFCGECSVAVIRECDGLAIGNSGQGESACIEASKGFVGIVADGFECYVFGISA